METNKNDSFESSTSCTSKEKHTCRPRDALTAIAKQYPTAWKTVDEFRAGRGVDLPNWPSWCFLPLGRAYAIVSQGATLSLFDERVLDISKLGALAAWRVTQGIYRFDPTIYEAVRNTPIEGDIPCEVLYHLPEWCVYLETPDMEMHGIWVHLECDSNNGRHELRILADSDEGQYPLILHIGKWSLKECIERANAECVRNSFPEMANILATEVPGTLNAVEPLLSLIIYLCTQAAEISGVGIEKPANPRPIRVKGGKWRIFPPNGVTTWDVGVRLGSALRRATQVSSTDSDDTRTCPRGHIRRAHWHGFRSGPMKSLDGKEIDVLQRKYELRWLPPIAVNLETVDTLPATIRPVN
jgi:hypothetical protein